MSEAGRGYAHRSMAIPESGTFALRGNISVVEPTRLIAACTSLGAPEMTNLVSRAANDQSRDVVGLRLAAREIARPGEQ
jgi:hypothetical protein